jgi:DNA-binding XRE family transcriptional regulator
MSKIGSNIRKIRSVKALSQNDFAQLFKLTRASIGAYEEGRAEPKIDAAIEIAKYFSITLSDIFTKDLTVNQLTKFNIQEIIENEAPIKKKSIPFINNSNWDSFFNGIDLSNEKNTIDYPPNFINGEIAIEITNQINSDFDNGTIVICSPIKTPTENTAYLLITKEKASISSLSEIKSLSIKEHRIYIINQKIENLRKGNSDSLEKRIEKLEKELKIITNKLK